MNLSKSIDAIEYHVSKDRLLRDVEVEIWAIHVYYWSLVFFLLVIKLNTHPTKPGRVNDGLV